MKTEAIKQFLIRNTLPDLAELYSHDMEVQVNVAQGEGERIEGEYLGKRWLGWTDGLQTWKSFRIPYKADSEPEYEDKPIRWDFATHVEAIGCTGWDWIARKSRWVAFDFDAIIGHSDKHAKKLTDQELKDIVKVIEDIDWVTIRKSTGGRGLHLYVFLDVPTQNHNEHAALARAVLSKLSSITGYDLYNKVDICGGNMWIWHRKMKEESLTLIKSGNELLEIPENWLSHVNVISGKSKKIRPKYIESDNEFDMLMGGIEKVKLNDKHKSVLDELDALGAAWWWDQDNHLAVCHTHDLLITHENLALTGPFKTNATGKSKPDHNCFMRPLRDGGWTIRRFGKGCTEVETWFIDASGWTTCEYNTEPDLRTAASCFNGLENEKGEFFFLDGTAAAEAAKLLGVHYELPTWAYSRQTTVKKHKDNRLVISFDWTSNDRADELDGWLCEKKRWVKIFTNRVSTKTNESEGANFDELVRHVITETGDDAGWCIRSESWRNEPLTHIKPYLQSLDYAAKEVTLIVGGCIKNAWTLVNRPFQDEYIGDRKWNRNAPQLRYTTKVEYPKHPTWDKVLDHVGVNLEMDEWCTNNGIVDGAEYLKCWLASLFQHPTEPLPYLFMFGPQKSGKSIFHEAIDLLVTSGVTRADSALTNNSGFNAELENTILCVIEETDLSTNKQAYNRIKDWVTARKLSIHRKQRTPYSIVNTTHWVQCANDASACPIFPGDTRITMIYVPEVEELIPKRELISLLEKEAENFLATLMKIELPEPNDRLNIPVLSNSDKLEAEAANMNDVEAFFDEKCVEAPGYKIKYSDVFDRFQEWLPHGSESYTIRRFGKSIPKKFIKGRADSGNWFLGNISFTPVEETKPPLRLQRGMLV